MSATSLTEQDWQVRLFVYTFFVERGYPPTYEQTAQHFKLDEAETAQIYQRLHASHALFLNPDTTTIRIANPLSAIPTAYLVAINGKKLWANCAWDSLGIPAMLGEDATIEATDPLSGQTITYNIKDGSLVGEAGLLVHFPLPFPNWYDDLVYT